MKKGWVVGPVGWIPRLVYNRLSWSRGQSAQNGLRTGNVQVKENTHCVIDSGYCLHVFWWGNFLLPFVCFWQHSNLQIYIYINGWSFSLENRWVVETGYGSQKSWLIFSSVYESDNWFLWNIWKGICYTVQQYFRPICILLTSNDMWHGRGTYFS